MAKESLKDIICKDVFKEIINGKYPANSIITERMLIEQYGYSKSPVREALIDLCKEDVLKSMPRLGYQVVQITPREIHNVSEMRVIVEMAAFEKTIKIVDDIMIKKLENHILESKKHLEEMDAFKAWHTNIDFHLLLCSFCNNQYMYKVLENILRIFSRGASQYYWDLHNQVNNKNDMRTHINLLSALKSRRIDDAKGILKEDILMMEKNFFL